MRLFFVTFLLCILLASGTAMSECSRIDAGSARLYLGDAVTKSGINRTLTASMLPSLLASRNFTDSQSVSYAYTQNITLGAGTFAFGTSGGDMADPYIYADIGSSVSAPLFSYNLSFATPLNISNSSVPGNALEMLGTNYTISTNSSFNSTARKIVLTNSSGGILTLSDGAAAKAGASLDTIEGTLVTLSGTNDTGVTQISIAMTGRDASHDSINQSDEFIDQVFGIIDVSFYGPDSASTDTVTIDNSSKTAATVAMTDFNGNSKTITYAVTDTSSFAPSLNGSATTRIHVLENETVGMNDYVVLAPSQGSNYTHLMQYTAASGFGSAGAYMELTDAFNNSVTNVSLTSDGYMNGTFDLDGNTYYVAVVSSASQTIALTWGTNAAVNRFGDTIMAYPLLQASGGEWVALTTNVTMTNLATYEFPTHNSSNTSFQYVAATMRSSYITLGRVKYYFTSGDSATLATTAGVAISNPAVLVIEEAGEDSTDATVQDAIIVKMADGPFAGVDLTIQAPILTAATQYSASLTSDTSATWYYDRYGTLAKHDSDSEGIVALTYPASQLSMHLAVGDATPLLSIVHPMNTTYASNPTLNFTHWEAAPHMCWYSLNGGANATLSTCGTNGTVLTSSEGTNNVTLFMNDTYGHIGSTTRYWTLDATAPSITINLPANSSATDTTPTFNVTFGETVNWSAYSLDGAANASMGNVSTYQTDISTLSTGSHNITVWANDSLGNMGSSTRHFTISAASAQESTGGGGGGGGGSSTTNAISETQKLSITANQTVELKFSDSRLDLQAVSISASDASNVVISVERRSAAPSESQKAPVAYNAYAYLTLSTLNLNDSSIKAAEMQFRVNKTWLADNGFKTSEVMLLRLSNGSWTELHTSFVREDAGFAYYEATTPGFSLFAITARKPVIAPTSTCGNGICETGESCPVDCQKPNASAPAENASLEESGVSPPVGKTIDQTTSYAWVSIPLIAIAVVGLVIELVRKGKRKKATASSSEQPA